LNRVRQILGQMKDEQIIALIKKKTQKGGEIKKKILVVEDEFGLQEIFRDIFLMEGYEVRVAVDGDNGYEIYCRFDPDLVFTDVVMPKMSGLELVRKIRETNPGIKVIFVSGFFGIKSLKRDLDEDILRYGYPALSKPFKASAMLEIVREYLH
jgi:DNA-binding NtrC family response regulator